MERYMTRYLIFLKSQLKKWTFYAQMIVYVVILYVIAGTTLPDANCCTVATCTNGQKLPETVVENIRSGDSMFTFVEAADEDEVKDRVISGKAECGFVFSDDFDKRAEKGDLDGSIRFISSDLTTKGLVARETVYASFAEVYGGMTLETEGNDIFGAEYAGAGKDAAMRYEGYLSGDDLFSTVFDESRVSGTEKTSDRRPLYLRIAVFVIVLVSMLYSENDGNDICLPGSRLSYMAALDLSVATFQSVLGFIFMRICRGGYAWYTDVGLIAASVLMSEILCRLINLIRTGLCRN